MTPLGRQSHWAPSIIWTYNGEFLRFSRKDQACFCFYAVTKHNAGNGQSGKGKWGFGARIPKKNGKKKEGAVELDLALGGVSIPLFSNPLQR